MDLVDDKVEQMDAHYATELFMYQYGLQRFSEDLCRTNEEQEEHAQTVAEQLAHLDKYLSQEFHGLRLEVKSVGKTLETLESHTEKELGDLEQGAGLAVQAVQAHLDLVEETMTNSEVEFSAEFLMLHAMVGKSAQDIDVVHKHVEALRNDMGTNGEILRQDMGSGVPELQERLGRQLDELRERMGQSDEKHQYVDTEMSSILSPMSQAITDAEARIEVLENQHEWTTNSLADLPLSPTAESEPNADFNSVNIRRMRTAVESELGNTNRRVDDLEKRLQVAYRDLAANSKVARGELGALQEGTLLALEAIQVGSCAAPPAVSAC